MGNNDMHLWADIMTENEGLRSNFYVGVFNKHTGLVDLGNHALLRFASLNPQAQAPRVFAFAYQLPGDVRKVLPLHHALTSTGS